MQIFKSKIFKRVLSLTVLIAFFLIGNAVLGELLTPISYSTYFNNDVRKLEENNSEVDLLFIGASRVLLTFLPEAFEETLEMETVLNAGSASQPPGATYYQLEDLIEKVHPQNVVIGVIWNGLRGEASDLQSSLIVYDRLPLKQKIGLVLDCFEKENYIYTNYVYRFRNNLEKISSIFNEKKGLIENQYIPDTSKNEYYEYRGFVYSKRSCDNGNFEVDRREFNEEEINSDKLKYLDACIELCKENGINVWLVTAPTSLARTYAVENYQEAVDFYEDYAEEKGVKYHNLNYLKNREVFLPDSLMRDINHVNGEGAHLVSEIYAQILAKENAGLDTSDYFYADLEEMKADVHRIVAVSGEITVCDTEKGTAVIEFDSLKNVDMEAYYQLEISLDGGETYDVLVEWTQEEVVEITLPGTEYYPMKVSAKSQLNGDVEAYQLY